MAETIQNFLTEYYSIAIPLSILINIIISLLGVIPSIFLTAINIQLFGVTNGTIISIAGEYFRGYYLVLYLSHGAFKSSLTIK